MARHPRRVLIFVAGLICILAGFALIVLPGPLTIPPIVLGLYIWSKEFTFAERLFEKAKLQFDEAWAAAKRKPVQSSLITGGGLIAAAAVIWAVLHFHLIAKAQDAVGL
jgi:Putative transmembrane protein (PGPGW)